MPDEKRGEAAHGWGKRKRRRRLVPDHEELIRQAAELAGTSLSDWIRDRLVRTARREIAEAARYEAAGKAPE